MTSFPLVPEPTSFSFFADSVKFEHQGERLVMPLGPFSWGQHEVGVHEAEIKPRPFGVINRSFFRSVH